MCSVLNVIGQGSLEIVAVVAAVPDGLAIDGHVQAGVALLAALG
jgi:hypothetical protein